MSKKIILLNILFLQLGTLCLYAMPTPLHSKIVITAKNPSNFLPAKIILVSGNIKNDKVILDWVVEENETADMFEVEKSYDGKNYKMAALVFGTDKEATDKYQFYERAAGKKVLYRIKMINKNKEASYSKIIEILP